MWEFEALIFLAVITGTSGLKCWHCQNYRITGWADNIPQVEKDAVGGIVLSQNDAHCNDGNPSDLIAQHCVGNSQCLLTEQTSSIKMTGGTVFYLKGVTRECVPLANIPVALRGKCSSDSAHLKALGNNMLAGVGMSVTSTTGSGCLCTSNECNKGKVSAMVAANNPKSNMNLECFECQNIKITSWDGEWTEAETLKTEESLLRGNNDKCDGTDTTFFHKVPCAKGQCGKLKFKADIADGDRGYSVSAMVRKCIPESSLHSKLMEKCSKDEKDLKTLVGKEMGDHVTFKSGEGCFCKDNGFCNGGNASTGSVVIVFLSLLYVF